MVNHPVKFIWIINDQYIFPTYISIRSLINALNIVNSKKVEFVCICQDESVIRLAEIFSDALIKVNFLMAPEMHLPTVSERYKVHTYNRLLRMWCMEYFFDQLVFLVDGDTVFSKQINRLFKTIGPLSGPLLCGVIEYQTTSDAYLFFAKDDVSPLTLSKRQKNDIYKEVFGSSWRTLLNEAQFNNGFIGFYNCQPLADQWRTFYLKGLNNRWVNPEDDQVPLSVAMNFTKQKKVDLNPSYNSLGGLNGKFALYHAWGGQWLNQLKLLLGKCLALTDFAKISKTVVTSAPLTLIENFYRAFNIDDKDPILYNLIEGKFDFENFYRKAILIPLEKPGNFLEIGSYSNGRGLCFLTELLQAQPNANIYNIFYKVSYSKCASILGNLSTLGVRDRIHFVNKINDIEDFSLDLVFFETDKHRVNLLQLIEQCLNKLRVGGMIAGYDFTGKSYYHQINKTLKQFCEDKGLNLSYEKKLFIVTRQPNCLVLAPK